MPSTAASCYAVLVDRLGDLFFSEGKQCLGKRGGRGRGSGRSGRRGGCSQDVLYEKNK